MGVGVKPLDFSGKKLINTRRIQKKTKDILKDNGVTIYTGPKTTFVHTGLGSDTNHSYTVYATNGSTNGPATSSLNVVAKGKLSYTFDSMEDSSEIRFTCLNSAHATGYMELMQDGVMVDYDNYSTNKSNNGGEALFGVYGLQPGQKYFYTLSVYDSTNSYYICSEDIVISTAPATPNVSFYETVYDYGYAYFQASQSTQGATSYEVYRDGLLVYSGVSSSFYDDSIEFGIPYTYEYYAVSAGGRSQPLIKEVTYDMPIDTNYTSDSQNITLNWFDLGGTITSWSLYDADDNEYLYYDPSTQYTFTGLQPNTTYDYQVVGINEDEGIEYHYYTSATTTAAAPVPLTPANLRWTEKGDNYTKIAWDTSSGATGYVLKRDNVQIYSGAGTSFTDTGLTSGTTYTYTLYASNSSGNSGNTTLTTTAGSSINATVTPTSSSSMGISWTNTDASVVKYTVTQTTNNKILTSLTTSTSVSDAGLNPNTTYTYKIEGFDSGGIKRYETIKSNTTLTGSLDISAPSATFNFGSVTVDGSIKNLNANLDKLTISDTRGTNAGWNVTVSASQFTQTTGSTPLKLPVNTLKLNGISSITQTSGSSALPTSSSGSPWIIDNGAIKILSANTNAGAGTFDIVFPANALILSIDTGKKVIDPLNKPTVYTNSLTWIVSTGP